MLGGTEEKYEDLSVYPLDGSNRIIKDMMILKTKEISLYFWRMSLGKLRNPEKRGDLA